MICGKETIHVKRGTENSTWTSFPCSWSQNNIINQDKIKLINNIRWHTYRHDWVWILYLDRWAKVSWKKSLYQSKAPFLHWKLQKPLVLLFWYPLEEEKSHQISALSKGKKRRIKIKWRACYRDTQNAKCSPSDSQSSERRPRQRELALTKKYLLFQS